MRDLIIKQELLNNARNISTSIDALYKPIVEKRGLTVIQSRILTSILYCEHATVGVLSKTIDMGCGNLSNMLKKLEKEGYVKRKRSILDERVVEIKLTEKGSFVLQSIEDDLYEKCGCVLESRTEDELSIIVAGLEKLNDLLKELDKIIC